MVEFTGPLVRLTPAVYADGIGTLRVGADPVAVAATVFDQDGDMPNPLRVSDLFVSWGQFVDHDLDLTPDVGPEVMEAPGLVAPIARSLYDPATGVDTPRAPVNVVTPELDGSMIYGSDATREAMLRSFEGGRMQLDANGFLPLAWEDGSMAGTSPTDPLFLAGDIRANENTGLTTLQTLFVREHNHWADRIAALHPDWSDEAVFQAARSVVEAEIQKITYEDWLPHLVGDAVGPATGYDPGVSTQVSVEFSTAAFRIGHTMVSAMIERIEEDGSVSPDGPISVMNSFFNNDPMKLTGIDSILRGQAASMAQASDAKMIDDLNFFLATPTGLTGFSLAAINILRGRDHGLGTYVDLRAELIGDIDPDALDPGDFSVITSDAGTQAELASVYESVLDVDAWVGGLAEDLLPGTQMGALFTHIVAEQFERTRAGDAGFGVIDAGLDADIAAEVARTSLSDIVLRNTDVSYMQQDAFAAAIRIAGTNRGDFLHGGMHDDLVMAGDGNDMVIAMRGNDAVYGGNGHDMLSGRDGDDALFGEAGNDIIFGGDGDDTITGGAGDDRLFGGEDADLFCFTPGSGRDCVIDFTPGLDQIVLSGYSASDFEAVIASAQDRWLSVELNLDGDHIMLRGVHAEELDASDFLIL